ncbi:Dabb family protein [Microbacterium kribbense]|uniref:Dabb family protein n=1 Tax=Microbacterium kribbense TaxID=433645 RepID=A0ABP7GH29_9MICO
MTIRHVVAFTLAATDAATRAEHAAEITRRVKALVGVVPAIRALSAGPGITPGDWDVALVVDVADRDGLEAYAVHPVHQEVLGYIRSVISDRVAVDFEL